MASTKASAAGAEQPSEKEMKNVILSTLRSGVVEVRPNKLRKLVCKKLQGATWTQFATCLEGLIDEKLAERKERGGETFITLAGATCSSAEGNSPNNSNAVSLDVKVHKDEMRIPRAVALHLHKRRHRKLKNIEINTKTKITIFGQLDGKQTASSLNELHTLQITAEVSANKNNDDNDETTKEEAEEAAKKHLKAAKLLIDKMVYAHKKNPDRFAPNKEFGGTLEEQAKREEDSRLALQNRKGQKREDDRAPYRSKTKKVDSGEGTQNPVNKRTKFY